MAMYIYTIFIFSVHLILYSSKYIHYDLLCLIHYIKKIIRRGANNISYNNIIEICHSITNNPLSINLRLTHICAETHMRS